MERSAGSQGQRSHTRKLLDRVNGPIGERLPTIDLTTFRAKRFEWSSCLLGLLGCRRAPLKHSSRARPRNAPGLGSAVRQAPWRRASRLPACRSPSKVNLTHLRALVDETVAQALTGVRGTNEATSLPCRVHEKIKQTPHNGRQTGYPAQAGLGREGRVCGSARSPRYGSDPTCALPETRRECGSQGEGEGEGKAANQGNAARPRESLSSVAVGNEHNKAILKVCTQRNRSATWPRQAVVSLLDARW